MTDDTALRRTVMIVALLNLLYFGVEFVVALAIGSLALFADSVDFLEDAAVNILIAVAVGWSASRRARLGRFLAALMLVPAAGFVWALVGHIAAPTPPDAAAMSLTGLGALVVNVVCALLLARHRRQSGSLAKAAFLSARNDALANLAIIAAAIVTAAQPTIWPDLVVGLGIAALNLDAARQVWTAARDEQASHHQP